MQNIAETRELLLARYESLADKASVLRAPELKALYVAIKQQPTAERAAYGQAVNALKSELEQLLSSTVQATTNPLSAIDVTAPWDVNSSRPDLIATDRGTIHPISREISHMADILERMGMRVYESKEIDDQYHMFEALNFPKGHPARDDYDTFMTVERDVDGEAFIAPAHTSTMQNRILRELKTNLEGGEPIAAVAIDRVFRNEDLDARHEHTFYQHEGIYVDRGVHAGMLVATLKTFLESYYQTELDVRINPFYFPFTEPSFEFSLSCPFCQKRGCNICSQTGWIELLGCGMIHPNVLKAADIDPTEFTGFAWGGGVDRLVMMKYGVEDVRHFESAKLDFLEQFS